MRIARSFMFASTCLVACAVQGTEPPGGSGAADPLRGAGVRGYIDPVTKQLAAPPEAAGPTLRSPGVGTPDFNKMREQSLPDGTVLLHPNGQVRTVSVVRRAPDGSFDSTCEALPASGGEAP
jgi:hypothetical protein